MNDQFNPLDNLVIDRLRQLNLPMPAGWQQVPTVKNLRVANATYYPDRVDVILQWTNPISANKPISGYRVNVLGAVANNQAQATPYLVARSPASISIPVTPGISGLTFSVQTLMEDGRVSPDIYSPTTGLQYQPGNATNSTPTEPALTTLTVTSSPTDLDTYVIPANTVVQGSIYRFTASGDYIMATSANPSCILTTYLNGSTTTGAGLGYVGTPGSVIRSTWRFWYEICFRSIGASGVAAVTSALAAPDAIGTGTSASTYTVDTTVPITAVVKASTFTSMGDFKQYIAYHEIFKDARF